MEVHGMVPWKTTFLCEQGVVHFYVSESECTSFLFLSIPLALY